MSVFSPQKEIYQYHHFLPKKRPCSWVFGCFSQAFWFSHRPVHLAKFKHRFLAVISKWKQKTTLFIEIRANQRIYPSMSYLQCRPTCTCNCQTCRVRILSFMFGNITEASNFWNIKIVKLYPGFGADSLIRCRQVWWALSMFNILTSLLHPSLQWLFLDCFISPAALSYQTQNGNEFNK